ncbi:hypothetical protein MTO96_011166 [Rhipicephalus appendiculatus]
MMTRSRAPLDEEFVEWLDQAVDSSDDDTEGPPVEEYAGWPQTTASSAEIDNLAELVVEDWDPFHLEYEEASSQCLLRVQEDMQDLSKNPLTGVHIDPVDTNRFVATMVTPSGGFFFFLLQCPGDYPMRPPSVRLINPDDGSFNANLQENGKVCLDILGTTDSSTWSPAHSIRERARRDPVSADGEAVISLAEAESKREVDKV